MKDRAYVRRRYLFFRSHKLDALQKPIRRILRGTGDLRQVNRAILFVERHDVGKGSPYIYCQSPGHICSPSLVAELVRRSLKMDMSGGMPSRIG